MTKKFKLIENIDLIQLGVHAVFFYEEKEEIINPVFSYLKKCLNNNEKCIYIDEKENQEIIIKRLKASENNIKKCLEKGQLKCLSREELYGNPKNFSADDIISLLKKNVLLALEAGFKGLSITGELKGIIDFEGGKEEIIKYEWKLHEQIFEKYPVSALCRYNINQFDNDVIKAAIELHDYIIWEDELHSNPYYIDPAGYKEKKVAEYEIKSWLKNINDYQKKERFYKTEIERKNEELAAYNEQLQAFNEEVRAVNEDLEASLNELELINNRFEKMIALVSEIDNLNTISEAEFLSKILEQAVLIIPEADFGCIYTFGEKYVNFVDCIGYDLERLKENKIENEAFYNRNLDIEIIDSESIKKRNQKYMEKEDFEKLLDTSLNKSKEIMYLDLEINGEKKAGISLDISLKNSKSFTPNSKKLFSAFYNIASSFYKLKEYNKLQDNFTKELISSTVKMLEMYDLYTRGHSENVAELAVKIAEEMGIKQKRIDDIYWAGLVHDLGKMLIPLEILNKEGKLTNSEYEVIKEHPVLGSNALKSSNSLQHIAKFVCHHHERWDGNGYPAGLKKEEIPLESQILCAADAWDAMRSKRTYRESLSFNHALAEIKDNKAEQFSPKVVDAFLNILSK